MPLLVSGDPHSRVPEYPTPNHCRYIFASLPQSWHPPCCPHPPFTFTPLLLGWWLLHPPHSTLTLLPICHELVSLQHPTSLGLHLICWSCYKSNLAWGAPPKVSPSHDSIIWLVSPLTMLLSGCYEMPWFIMLLPICTKNYWPSYT